MHDVSITYPSYVAIDSDSRAGMGWRDDLKEEERESDLLAYDGEERKKKFKKSFS